MSLGTVEPSADLGGGNLRAWIEEASHWDSDASQRSGLSESSIDAARDPPGAAIGQLPAGASLTALRNSASSPPRAFSPHFRQSDTVHSLRDRRSFTAIAAYARMRG